MKISQKILALAIFYDTATEKLAAKWKKMPPGWKAKSRKKFFKHLSDNSVSKCMKKMKDHVSSPGAFCGSLADRVSKKTNWRGE